MLFWLFVGFLILVICFLMGLLWQSYLIQYIWGVLTGSIST